MDALSATASVAGLLSLTIQITAGLDSLISSYRTFSEDVTKLSMELASLQRCIEHIRSAMPALAKHEIPDGPNFDPFKYCESTLLEIQKLVPDTKDRQNLETVTKISIIDKFKWIRNKSKIQDYVTQLQSHKTTLAMYISGEHFQSLKTGLEKHEMRFVEQDKRAEERFDAWCKDEQSVEMSRYFAPAKTHPADQLQRAEGRRHVDTGLWFIRGHNYERWLALDQGKLWIYGIPGAGKTILASLAMITERRRTLTATRLGVVFFFCDYKSSETQGIHAIMGSLLFQLSTQNAEAKDLLHRFYSKTAKLYSSIDVVPLTDLCQVFGELTKCFDSVTVIVDGLDECEEQRKVTECLAGLSSAGSRVRSLFFSRDIADIEEPLTKHNFIAASVAADNGDIKAYVDAEVERRIQEGDLSVEEESLKVKIRETLIDGAQGMFRWVECQLDALCEKGCPEDIVAALRDLPVGIPATYDRILSKINTEKQVVALALKWICLSKEPLTTGALAEIVNQRLDGNYEKRRSPYNIKKLLKYCGSFVRKVDSRDLVEFAHYSVKEYLLQLSKESRFAEFRVDAVFDRNFLGEYCLGYLLLKDYDFSSQLSREKHNQLLDSRRFRKCALRFWRDYAVGEDGNFHSKELLKQAIALFSSRGHIWFESFIHETFLNEPICGYGRTLSQAAEDIKSTLPIHWASSFRLPELTELLIKQYPKSANATSEFGTPLDCTLTSCLTSCLTSKDSDDYRNNKALDNMVRIIINYTANVDQWHKFHDRDFCSIILTKLNRPTALLLLQSGLYCDRQFLQELKSNSLERSRSDDEKSTGLCFEDIEETNILEYDLEAWHRMVEETSAAKLKRSHNDQQQNLPANEEYSGPPENFLAFCVKLRKTKQATAIIQNVSIDINRADVTGNTPLHYACSNADVGLIRTLLSAHADVHVTNDEGQTPAHLIAAIGQEEIVKVLIKDSKQMLVADNLGSTPLHIAASSGNQNFFRYFCESPENIQYLNPIDHDGFTPFLSAVKAGQLQVILSLVQHLSPEDIRRKTLQGLSALHLACQCQSDSALDLLLKEGLDPNISSNDGSTALHIAVTARIGSTQATMVDSLLQSKANPLILDTAGNYPVHLLFFKNYANLWLNSIQRLLQSSVGCENVKNGQGKTPLQTVCLARGIKSSRDLKIYLDLGHDLFIEDFEGQSSFHILLRQFIQDLISEELMEYTLECTFKRYGTKISRSFRIGLIKALIKALKSEGDTVCSLLLSLLVDLREEYAPDDEQPIHVAAEEYCPIEIFCTIVEKTPDLGTFNSAGRTPLHLAAAQNNLLKVKAILAKSPSCINQRSEDTRQDTPLLCADISETSGQEVAQFLISHGADINMKSADGLSIIHSACMYGDLGILQNCTPDELQAAGRVTWIPDNTTWKGIGCVHFAALESNTCSMEFLLDIAGFDVDEPSEELMTPLHIATFNGDCKMARYLLQKNASIDKVTAKGDTALSLAFCSKDPEIAQIMIDAGALLSFEPSSVACIEVLTWNKPEQRLILQQALKAHGGNLQGLSLENILSCARIEEVSSEATQKLRAILQLSIEKTNLDLCTQILSKGIDLSNPIDACGVCPPLIYSLRLGKFNLARMFVDHGADVNAITCNKHLEAGYDTSHYASNVEDGSLLRLILLKGYSNSPSLVHALHIAAARSFPLCIKAILDNQWPTGYQAGTLTPGPLSQMNGEHDTENNPIIDVQVKCNPISWHWELCFYLKAGGPLEKWTALHIAVRNNDPLIVDLLLSRGANPNIADSNGATALHVAARNGFTKIIGKLVSRGADLNFITSDGATPIYTAIQNGFPEAAIKLIDLGADPVIIPQNGFSPLEAAVSKGFTNVVSKLLGSGVDPDTKSKSGTTALHFAARHGNMEVVSKLIEGGARINITNSLNFSPLHVAAEFGFTEIFDELIKNGADLGIRSTTGITALQLAAKNGHTAIVSRLFSSREGLHGGMNDNSAQLELIIEHGNVEMLTNIIAYGVNLHVTMTNGFTPLHLAAAVNKPMMIKLLVENGINPNLTMAFSDHIIDTKSGVTPLHIAAGN